MMIFGLILALSAVGQSCSAASCSGAAYANQRAVFAVPATVTYQTVAPVLAYRQAVLAYSACSVQASTVYVAKAKPFYRLRVMREARRAARMTNCL